MSTTVAQESAERNRKALEKIQKQQAEQKAANKRTKQEKQIKEITSKESKRIGRDLNSNELLAVESVVTGMDITKISQFKGGVKEVSTIAKPTGEVTISTITQQFNKVGRRTTQVRETQQIKEVSKVSSPTRLQENNIKSNKVNIKVNKIPNPSNNIRLPQSSISRLQQTITPSNIKIDTGIYINPLTPKPNTNMILSAEKKPKGLLAGARYELDLATSKQTNNLNFGSTLENVVAAPTSFIFGFGSGVLSVGEFGFNVVTKPDETIKNVGEAITSPVKTISGLGQNFVKNPFKFSGEVLGDFAATKGIFKGFNKVKELKKGSKFTITRASNPTIIQKDKVQKLVTNNFDEIIQTKTPPKVENILDFEYTGVQKQTIQKAETLATYTPKKNIVPFGTKTDGILDFDVKNVPAKTETLFTKGKGSLNLKDDIFTIKKAKVIDPFDVSDLKSKRNAYYSKETKISKNNILKQDTKVEMIKETNPLSLTDVKFKNNKVTYMKTTFGFDEIKEKITKIDTPFTYNKVDIKKTSTVEKSLTDASFNAIGIKKGKFIKPVKPIKKIDAAEITNIEYKSFFAKPPKPELLFTTNKQFSKETKSFNQNNILKQSKKTSNIGTTGATTETILKTESKTVSQYNPIVSVKKTKTTTSNLLFVSDGSFDNEIGVYAAPQQTILKPNIDLGLSNQKNTLFSISQVDIKRDQLIKPPKNRVFPVSALTEVFKPNIDNKLIDNIKIKVSTRGKTKQDQIITSPITTPKPPEQKQIFENLLIQKGKQKQDQIIMPPITINTPKGRGALSPLIPTFNLITPKKKDKNNNKRNFIDNGFISGFGVKVKSKGKFKTIATGLSRGEALSLGGLRTGTTTSRTFKLFRTGKIKSRNTKSSFNLDQFKSKGAFTFVERTKYAISTEGEVKGLKKAKKEKNFFKNIL